MRAERKGRAAVTPPLTKPNAFSTRIFAQRPDDVKGKTTTVDVEHNLAADLMNILAAEAPGVDSAAVALEMLNMSWQP